MKTLFVVLLGFSVVFLGCNKGNPDVSSADDVSLADETAAGVQEPADEDEYMPGGGGSIAEYEVPLKSDDGDEDEAEEEDDEAGGGDLENDEEFGDEGDDEIW